MKFTCEHCKRAFESGGDRGFVHYKNNVIRLFCSEECKNKSANRVVPEMHTNQEQRAT